MSSTQLPSKDPTESVYITFAYASELGSGETVGSATVTCTVLSGVDPNPSAVLVGAPSVQSPNVVQEVTGGLDGNQYLLLCVAPLAGSARVLTRKGLLPVSSS